MQECSQQRVSTVKSILFNNFIGVIEEKFLLEYLCVTYRYLSVKGKQQATMECLAAHNDRILAELREPKRYWLLHVGDSLT